MTIREITKSKGLVLVGASIVTGLILARFVMISPIMAIIVLSSAIALAVTILLRRVDYLIFCWFVLTTLISLFMYRWFPPQYFQFVGRGIFWGVLVCIIAAWAVDNVLSGRQFIPFDSVSVKISLLLFLLWCSLTVAMSLDPYNSVKKFSHIVIALCASYMFYDFFARNPNNIDKVLSILFFLLIFISIGVTISGGQSIAAGIPVYKKISLWFWNPNSLGYILFVSTPVLFATRFHFVSSAYLKPILYSIVIVALILSFSRAAWLATSVAISFLLWKSQLKTVISVVVIAFLVVIALMVPIVGEDTMNYISGQQYSGRKEIWTAAWNSALDYPFFGTGPGNYWKVMPQYIETPWLKSADTHNVYLRNALEMGFPSVLLYIAFYAVFIRSSMRIEKELRSEHLKSVSRGATATLLGLAVHDIFENGVMLTAFDAAEYSVMLPYILISLPFAAKKLEETRAASGAA